MTTKRHQAEYEVREGAYAVNRNDYSQIGTIRKISHDGLCFQYICADDNISEALEIDIVVRNGNFYLQRIPCKTVSNTIVNDNPPCSSICICEQLVRFEPLSPDQKSKLDYFLRHYTRQ